MSYSYDVDNFTCSNILLDYILNGLVKEVNLA